MNILTCVYRSQRYESPQAAERGDLAAGRPFTLRMSGPAPQVGDLLVFPDFFCAYAVRQVSPVGTFPWLSDLLENAVCEVLLTYPPKKHSLSSRELLYRELQRRIREASSNGMVQE